jgi:hypothetical protein
MCAGRRFIYSGIEYSGIEAKLLACEAAEGVDASLRAGIKGIVTQVHRGRLRERK